ncbi:MAG: hypothetical protein RLZZ535_207 [Cyanobacteriota bacterium]|jgi:hypothetical protein
MANPNPKTDHLNRFPKRDGATEACARRPVQVKIPQSQYDKWMNLPVDLRNQILRDVIEKTLQEKYSLTA